MAILIIDSDLMRTAGFNSQQIAKIRKCQADSKDVEKDSVFFPIGKVQELLGITSYQLVSLAKSNRFPTRIKKHGRYGYDGYKILEYYWKAINDFDIETEIKKEKHLKLVIENKKKMGALIEKEAAEDRSVTLLKALGRMFLYTVKMSAPLLVGCPSNREAEKIMNDRFKEMFDILNSECKKTEWADEKEKD